MIISVRNSLQQDYKLIISKKKTYLNIHPTEEYKEPF